MGASAGRNRESDESDAGRRKQAGRATIPPNISSGETMVRCILAAVLLATASIPTHAQGRWYAGASAGATRTHSELVFNRESTLVNATDISTDFDDRDRAWKAFAGFRLNRVIALEASYVDLGEHRMFTRMVTASGFIPGSIEIARKVDGFGLDIVATAPLDLERFRLFARVGAFRAKLQASAQLGGHIVFTNGNPEETRRSVTQHEDIFRTGLGVEWQLTRNLALRAEYERFAHIGRAFRVGGSGTTGEADTDMASIGILATF
jgi:opacity protein-like surface antigen